ncbi:hypothetical protein J2S22_001154 [Rhodoplanes tepidamans]|nr:hypothetical protein [Rhodoplanes tepidamans]
MDLHALVAEPPDADVLREMGGFAAQPLMELEIEERTGAASGETSAERIARRNRYPGRVLAHPSRTRPKPTCWKPSPGSSDDPTVSLTALAVA